MRAKGVTVAYPRFFSNTTLPYSKAVIQHSHTCSKNPIGNARIFMAGHVYVRNVTGKVSVILMVTIIVVNRGLTVLIVINMDHAVPL